jgi:hypothetical protein
MRRQIKPFTIEHKRGGRSPQPVEPLPFDIPAPPPEPAPVNSSGATRWAAAEALFSTQSPAPDKASDPEPAVVRPAATTGRILPSLIEPPAPTPVYDVEDAPKRRGRKPGSRNKPREGQGPKTIDTVMRNVFEFWTREEEEEERPETEVAAAAPAIPVLALGAVVQLRLKRRGRVAREELPRGQRWKARLPRFAR